LTWRVGNVSEQRVKFAVRADSGAEEMKALCEEFGISRPTGYLWLKRFRECDRLQDLGEVSRRPHFSPGQTPRPIEDKVIAYRKMYPDWGAAKLVTLLRREQIDIPRITVHRILLRNGLVREQDRHRPAIRRFERGAPNELWQMDFKGMPEAQKGCLPLVILDDHSRYLVGLFATGGTRAEPVQKHLMTVFRRDGLPEGMLMDHGTPWWNMQSQSGWTWLTVWLMKQGIRLYLSGYRHPQTQGKIERCNGSLESAMRKRPKPAAQPWQAWLDAYREEHKMCVRTRPCRWTYLSSIGRRAHAVSCKRRKHGIMPNRLWSAKFGKTAVSACRATAISSVAPLQVKMCNCSFWKTRCSSGTVAPWCASLTCKPAPHNRQTLDSSIALAPKASELPDSLCGGNSPENSLRREDFDLPFPVSPPGKAGAGGFPPRRSTLRVSKKRWHASMLSAPPTRGLSPPCVSPRSAPAGRMDSGTFYFGSNNDRSPV
jgi:transposase InsO family protein